MGADATLAEGTGYCNMMNAMPGAYKIQFMNVLKKECVIDIFVMKYLTLCLVTQE